MMNEMLATTRRVLSLGALLGTVVLGGCDDDPVEVHDHDEGDVAGFRIEQILPGGGRSVLVTYDDPADPDTLFLGDSDEIEVEIVWLDEHGDVVEPDADEHGWELEENHSAISGFEQSSTASWQGTFSTTDLVDGNTVHGAFSVTLLHGDEAEFTTPQIPAAVVAD